MLPLSSSIPVSFVSCGLQIILRLLGLCMWILFQMRPDIKKDVFHLNWAPESLPADEVSIVELRVYRVHILLNIL